MTTKCAHQVFGSVGLFQWVLCALRPPFYGVKQTAWRVSAPSNIRMHVRSSQKMGQACCTGSMHMATPQSRIKAFTEFVLKHKPSQ
eukprot:5673975-Amphidinium_carterae.1